MASSNADLRTRIATLRHEILSYKPGKAVPCNDEQVVLPDKLVIGMIDPCGYTCMYDIDHALSLRRVLHDLLYEDVELSQFADTPQTSTDDQGRYLTDSISVIAQYYLDDDLDKEDFLKVGSMVLLIESGYSRIIKKWIRKIKEVTGHVPLCALLPNGDLPKGKARNELKQLWITHIYEISLPGDMLSDEGQFQGLDLLHGCLQESDRAFATNELKNICTNPRCESLYEETKKEARREVERLQSDKEDEKARADKEKRSLAAEMTKKLESKHQHVETVVIATCSLTESANTD